VTSGFLNPTMPQRMPISPYLARLRVQVGHGLLTLPGVSACIFDEVGRILLARHVDSGMWALPGGAVEPDEDAAAAVAREVREELGIEVALQGVIGVYGGPEFRVTYPNGDQVSYVTIVYACSGIGTSVAVDNREVDEVRFMADLGGLDCARWVPSVHADAVRWWRQRSARARHQLT
jgi:ADP-ribose pyrophosphatase YjhB (NUDIX family)